MCLWRMGGWLWWRTIASAVLAKLSVLLGSTCLWLLSPPTHRLSLSNTHPQGWSSIGVILHILCGKGQRGALRLTPSLPHEKVWSTKTHSVSSKNNSLAVFLPRGPFAASWEPVCSSYPVKQSSIIFLHYHFITTQLMHQNTLENENL